MYHLKELGGKVNGLQDPATLALGHDNTTDIQALRQQVKEKRLLVQILHDGANHFVSLVMLEDGIASVYDSAGKKVSNDLMRQLRSIFGEEKRIHSTSVSTDRK